MLDRTTCASRPPRLATKIREMRNSIDTEILKDRGLVVRKGDYLRIQTPAERHRQNRFDAGAQSFPSTLDGLHAALVLRTEDGPRAVEAMLKRTNLLRDASFLAAFEALYRAIPPLREEWQGLERLRAEFLADRIEPILLDEEPVDPALFDEDGEDGDLEEDEE